MKKVVFLVFTVIIFSGGELWASPILNTWDFDSIPLTSEVFDNDFGLSGIIGDGTPSLFWSLEDVKLTESGFMITGTLIVIVDDTPIPGIPLAALRQPEIIPELAGVPVPYEIIEQANGQNGVPGQAPVPEPASLMLMGLGLFGLAGVRRREKK